VGIVVTPASGHEAPKGLISENNGNKGKQQR
jgi:hypothetical protein